MFIFYTYLQLPHAPRAPSTEPIQVLPGTMLVQVLCGGIIIAAIVQRGERPQSPLPFFLPFMSDQVLLRQAKHLICTPALYRLSTVDPEIATI